ncbi:MAG: hypothetical protein ABSB30_00630 [Terracidiphilus sp.]
MGRPRVVVNAEQVATPQAAGASWKVIPQRVGISVGTACCALQPPSKNMCYWEKMGVREP